MKKKREDEKNDLFFPLIIPVLHPEKICGSVSVKGPCGMLDLLLIGLLIAFYVIYSQSSKKRHQTHRASSRRKKQRINTSSDEEILKKNEKTSTSNRTVGKKRGNMQKHAKKTRQKHAKTTKKRRKIKKSRKQNGKTLTFSFMFLNEIVLK